MRFIILALLAIFVISSCGTRKKTDAKSDVYYTCSMHPQVIANEPGKCPICHMDLIEVSRNKQEVKNEVMLSDQQVQLGNIRVDTLSTSRIGTETVLTGTLAVDQQNTNAVSARVMGRVDRMYNKNIGDYISRGAPLYDLYSEELNNAKQEYLLAIEKRRVLGNATIDFRDVVQSAKNKLLLWGMSEAQIARMVRSGEASNLTTFYARDGGYVTQINVEEGQYVMEGGTILRLAELTSLWVEAQLYTAQLGLVDLDSRVEVQVPGMPHLNTVGKVDFLNPETTGQSRITLLRVVIPNEGGRLRPGMPAYVVIKGRQSDATTLPIDAVIQDSKGATVWVQTGKNTYRSKMVQLGLENAGRIEITAGLDSNDIVVVSGAYLINSEYVFKTGSDPMAGHSH